MFARTPFNKDGWIRITTYQFREIVTKEVLHFEASAPEALMSDKTMRALQTQ